MSETPDNKDLNRALFLNLIIMFGSSAMQQLGQTSSPEAKTEPINLDGAQVAIDMLDMLQAKTNGNLDDDEKRILSETITSLRLAYVNVEKMEKARAPEKTAGPAQAPAQTPEESKVKFRKSYGEN